VIAPDNLDWLLQALDSSRHLAVAPKAALANRRRSPSVELRAQDVLEWPDPRKSKVKRKPKRNRKRKRGSRRGHKSLRVTPAMAANVTDRL
jgi:hypothetical protein